MAQTVDADRLLGVEIQDLLQTVPPLPTGCSIYKVPVNLRSVNEAAYTPKTISIGPLHHGDERLKPMEAHKKRYLRASLGRNNEIPLDACLRYLRGLEEKVRENYYEDQFNHEFSSDEFVTMMLFDSFFIVELFILRCKPETRNEHDPMFNADSVYMNVYHDLMLLENQLPLFLLEGVFDFIGGYQYTRKSFFELLVDYFLLYVKHEHTLHLTSMKSSGYEIKHFVDYFLNCYLPSGTRLPPRHQGNRKTIYLPSATELNELGIRIKKGMSGCFLDIRFTNGVLEIPILHIIDSSEDRLRNLIAMEQCHRGSKYYITDYVLLMDFLINTPSDVALLRSYGVIDNFLGSDEDVSRLLNNIGKGVLRDTNQSHYYELLENVNAYCNTPWHVWRAKLRREYFNNPWAIISLNAAVALLICTLIQTICSILSMT